MRELRQNAVKVVAEADATQVDVITALLRLAVCTSFLPSSSMLVPMPSSSLSWHLCFVHRWSCVTFNVTVVQPGPGNPALGCIEARHLGGTPRH